MIAFLASQINNRNRMKKLREKKEKAKLNNVSASDHSSNSSLDSDKKRNFNILNFNSLIVSFKKCYFKIIEREKI
jgi:hypothetical protein